MKKPLVIHPFLFAIFPILFLFSHNIEQLPFFDPLFSILFMLGFTLLLVFLSKWIFRDNQKAGIVVSFLLILFFSYGHVFDLIKGWKLFGFEVDRHRYLLLTWCILFVSLVYFVLRVRKDFFGFTRIANIFAFTLVIISIVNIGVYKFKTKGNWQDHSKSMENREITATDSGNGFAFRDIYYIILDGYASSHTLKETYDYDNAKFEKYLSGKGFYVASESRSNYALTFLSLASSLNMKYVNYLTDMVGFESKDRTMTYQMIKDSKVKNFLRMKGYKFIHFSSGWGPTDYNEYADFNFNNSTFNEFFMVLIQTTMLRPFKKFLIGDDARARVLFTFSKLAEIHKIEGPKFVFAHILPPHPPYIFGANGEPMPEAKLKMTGYIWGQKENYLNQLIFVNKKVESLVEEILLGTEIAPIIILQADHGPASTFTSPDSGGWDDPTENMLRERTRIFNAYYLPSDENLLYESVTPVNTFRVILNLYFNTNYKFLNDISYYSNYEYPYQFVNVTDKVVYD